MFLYDEHAATHSVTLRELGEVLAKFKANILGRGEFELVSFHSCSMSSLEVAFQLKDTANYMLASQGPAFVGSWPYREILIRVFDDVDNGRLETPKGVEEMFRKFFDYVYHNSTDYLLAGYSFELCLCGLSSSKLTSIGEPLKALSDALVEGLRNVDNPLVKYCILLAHWKSQSYWEEHYTDLYDFCFCLDGYCGDFVKSVEDPSPYRKIQTACGKVMDILAQPSSEHSNNPVIRADFAGPDSQYSHGLSVFFPWTRPTSDRAIMKEDEQHKTEYEQYQFNQTGWFSFLNQYWGSRESVKDSTMRGSHRDEEDPRMKSAPGVAASADDDLFEDMVSIVFNSEGPLNSRNALSKKVNPPDPTGDECTCGSIKNHLRDTRTRRKRGKSAKPTFPINQTLFGD